MNNITLQNLKKALFLAVLSCSVTSFSQEKLWSLEACVNHALEHNITIKQAENSLLTNDQDIIAAKGQFLPSVSGSVSQGLSLGTSLVAEGIFANRTSHSTNAGLSVSQTVFNGFRNLNNSKSAFLNRETNELELSRIKDDISLNVVNAYLNVLFNKENLETAQAQMQFSEKQLNQVKSLVDAGVQPKANIYDADATLSRDAQQVTLAENNFNLALLSLSQLLQVPYNGFNVEIIDINSPSEAVMYKSVDPVLNYALENRNEIKIAEKNIESAELNTEISKGGYLPSVSLSYGFGTNAFYSNLSSNEEAFLEQLNNNKGHSFNLGVSIPIFSRFQNKTNVAKSKIQEDNSKLRLQQAKIDLESNIQRAYTDAQAGLKSYLAAKKSLESQTLAFNNSKERFDIGVLTNFDLEQARVQLINAESSLINAKYDFVFKTKVLDFYMGKSLVN
ncbi:TolC family protein [Algibacter sp. L4_22]|uniref:TolC family protein n=1 Tax=Algibacter sp. L4_22 TaxID=2942477 RepID=UPI00201B6E67|nr:TolC family protein [Algibacter sp. L4_22]MCL5130161.1 TolC family protein [Algibacter sp. L4_22]